MRLLLDTHTLLWWVTDDAKLPASCASLINDKQNVVAISVVSAYEIRFKATKGLLPNGEQLALQLEELAAQADFEVLSITLAHALRAGAYGMAHRDPFDRLIGAQAIAGDYVLVSNDAALDQFGVKRVWT